MFYYFLLEGMMFTLALSLRGWVFIIKDISNKLIDKINEHNIFSYLNLNKKDTAPKTYMPIAAYVYLYDGNIEIQTIRYKKYDEIPKIYLPYTLIDGKKTEIGKLLADPIKYNDMRNICDSYYCKITSNIPEYVKYDSENQIMLSSFTWWCHGNHIFWNENKKKISEFPDHGMLTIKFYSDKKCSLCIHDGWTISVKKLKEVL